MSDNDIEKDVEQAKPAGEIEEKRIKPAVIRRRSKKVVQKLDADAEAEQKAKEAKEAAAAAKKAEKAAKEAAKAEKAEKAAKAAKAKKAEKEPEAKEPKKAAKAKKAAAPKAEAGAKKPAKAKAKAEEPVAKEAKKKKAKAAPVEEAPKPAVAAPEAKAEGKPAAAVAPEDSSVKKEVTDFTKEAAKKFLPSTQPVKVGRKRRSRHQQKPRHRRQQSVQSSRPLLKTEITTPKAAKRVIRIIEAISVAEFSQRLGVKSGDIIKKLMGLGIMATVNQLIDIDAASLVAQDFGYEVESSEVHEDTLIDVQADSGDEGAELVKRPPVVTVMGHVDHGKTSLLDVIRETSVVSGEAGGITQHIGAYHVHLDKGDITFLDTPGHEAFTSMRARGAKATDIVVLVVAADDGVKPQTIEAINHAKAAEVPIIVAINKIDLPQADPTRVKQEMSEHGLIGEDWGGDTLFVEVSAKAQTNIKELLEAILLQSDMLELKSPVETNARGLVVEAKLDKGRGPVATVLIQSGTLRTGDAFVTGCSSGRVRAMISDWGQRITDAGPSMPVEILGLSVVPEAGDDFTAVADDATAKQITGIRMRKAQDQEQLKSAKVSLADLYDKITQGEVKELKVVIKADVQGSIEAVKDALVRLSTEAVTLVPIHTGVGGISEGDCMLASASNAIVIGFNVRPEKKASLLAEKEELDLRLYNVIYDLVEDIRNAMEGMLEPIIREKVMATVEIRDVIRITKVGNIAGSFVLDGTVTRGARARLLRDNVVVYEGKISTLRRFKDDVKEVASGYECGIGFEKYNDIKVGDIIEVYVLEEEAAKL